MTEEREPERIDAPETTPGWLEMIGHRSKTFIVLAVSLSLDALFMLFWLCVHVLFTFTTTKIEDWLSTALHPIAIQSASIEPFRTFFFLTTSLLDFAICAVIIYFIYIDIKTFCKKIASFKAMSLQRQ